MSTTTLKNRLAIKTTEVEANDLTTTTLFTNSFEYAALNSNSLEIIEENLKNQPMSLQLFDIVKSPSGGSTVFTVPGISGDEVEKSLTGIILDFSSWRAAEILSPDFPQS